MQELQFYLKTNWEADAAYNDSVKAARTIISNKESYVILGTETTGLSSEDEILEISIIDLDGKPLLNTLVKPICDIEPDAEAIHGISASMLENEPTFADVYPKIMEAIAGKQICIYNKRFDSGKLKYCTKLHGLPKFNSEVLLFR